MNDFIARQVDRYEWMMGRTPPLFKIVIWALWIAVIVPLLLVSSMAWLVGFYTCKQCKETLHVFTMPKAEVVTHFIGDSVCKQCEAAYKREHLSGRD